MFIQLCKKYPNKTKLLKEIILNYPTAEIKVKSCIKMCKTCKKKPCALVEGEKLKKKSIEKFILALEEATHPTLISLLVPQNN